MHKSLTAGRHAEAVARLRKSGYASGGDIAQDKALVKKAIKEHDDQQHGGKQTHLRLRRGGNVGGAKAMPRLDKRARGGKTSASEIDSTGRQRATDSDMDPTDRFERREANQDADEFARGGGVKHKGHVTIAIHTGAGQAEKQQALHQGLQAGAMLGARAAAAKLGGGRPPMAPPPGGAMAGGPPPAPTGPMPMRPAPGMPGPTGGPMRKGGVVDMKLKTGAGGGMARLAKNKAYADGGHVHVRSHMRKQRGGSV